MIYQKFNFLFLLSISMIFVGCSSNSSSTNMFVEKNIIKNDEKRVIKRASELRAAIDENGSTIHDDDINSYPNKILNKLLSNNKLHYNKDINFNIKIVRNSMLNAFALADGSIYIHSGILSKMDNEAQLALLIGHEMSHVTYKHSIKQSRNTKDTALVAQIFGSLAMPFDFGLSSLLIYSSISGYSQNLENEADKEGIKQLVKAGYNPKEASKLFNIMLEDIKLNDLDQPFFFSSHPRVQERINHFETIIENDYKDTKGFVGEFEFQKYVKAILIETIEIDLKLKRFETAKVSIDTLINRYEDNSYGYYLLAEYYRLNKDKRDYKKSFENYNLSIKKEQYLANAYKGLGLLELKEKNKNQAKVAFEKYLQLNSEAKDKAYILNYIKMCENI